jgi:sulfatase modifying factor 1
MNGVALRDRIALRFGVFIAGLMLCSTPSSSQALTLDLVPVADTANGCDLLPSIGCFGAVTYEYEISTYEITNTEYAEFLNAVADTDSHELFNNQMVGIIRTGSSGSYFYEAAVGREQNPVWAVQFFSAIRFVNWLDNGQPIGAQTASTTEDGAYTFSGPSSIGARHSDAVFALPSEDEWYKAAYYDGDQLAYFDYPSGSNTPTICEVPTATPNRANCFIVYGSFADVGSYSGSPSPYGTFDQGGNAWEWNETLIGSMRGVRGGAWTQPASYLQSLARVSADPASTPTDIAVVGFRVVQVPEPGRVTLILAGSAGLFVLSTRRKWRIS